MDFVGFICLDLVYSFNFIREVDSLGFLCGIYSDYGDDAHEEIGELKYLQLRS